MNGNKTILPRGGNQEWCTPRPLFEKMNELYQYTIDAAASPENALLPRYYTREQDGLAQDWTGEKVWVNPPFEKIAPWVEKANLREAAHTTLFIPARCDRPWFADIIEDGGADAIDFIQSRVRFVGARTGYPESTMMVHWTQRSPRPRKDIITNVLRFTPQERGF